MNGGPHDDGGFALRDDGNPFGPTDYSDKHAEVFAGRVDRGLMEHKERQVLALAGDVAGTRVLDAGSGVGNFASLFSARGADVVACDFSPAMVTTIRERYDRRFPVVRSSIEAVPARTSTCDVVVALDVIEHLYHPDDALADIHRVLRPNGVLLLSTDREGVMLGRLPEHARRTALRSGRRAAARLRRAGVPIPRFGLQAPATPKDADLRTPLCTHTKEYSWAELVAMVERHGFRLEAVDSYPIQRGLSRAGRAAEVVARGRLARFKWEFVICRFRRI